MASLPALLERVIRVGKGVERFAKRRSRFIRPGQTSFPSGILAGFPSRPTEKKDGSYLQHLESPRRKTFLFAACARVCPAHSQSSSGLSSPSEKEDISGSGIRVDREADEQTLELLKMDELNGLTRPNLEILLREDRSRNRTAFLLRRAKRARDKRNEKSLGQKALLQRGISGEIVAKLENGVHLLSKTIIFFFWNFYRLRSFTRHASF